MAAKAQERRAYVAAGAEREIDRIGLIQSIDEAEKGDRAIGDPAFIVEAAKHRYKRIKGRQGGVKTGHGATLETSEQIIGDLFAIREFRNKHGIKPGARIERGELPVLDWLQDTERAHRLAEKGILTEVVEPPEPPQPNPFREAA